jgi:quercetin dioxygenase-like cupin family protein
VRYPPTLVATRHRHTAAHTIVVIEGELLANGQPLGTGGYAHFPAGTPMRHARNRVSERCSSSFSTDRSTSRRSADPVKPMGVLTLPAISRVST